MIIPLTKEIFEQNVPSAIDPESNIFDSCQLSFEFAENDLALCYLGRECLEYIVANNEKALALVQRYIVVQGFKDCIAMLDVTLTNNGFAVTSTEQMAPASKDRVMSLVKQCDYIVRTTRDQLIQVIFTDKALAEIWFGFIEPTDIIEHFFWRIKDVSFILGGNEDNKISLQQIDSMVMPYLSAELLGYLWDATAHNKLTDDDKKLLYMLKPAYHGIARGADAKRSLAAVLSFINNNIDSFPSYKDSSLNRSYADSGYQNSKDDAIFVM